MKILITIAGVALAVVAVFSACPQASAQFTIKRYRDASLKPQDVFISPVKATTRNAYFDLPAHEAMLRRRRRERNTVEFNAALETSLQQFENWTGAGPNNFYALANIYFRHQYKRDKLSTDYRVEAFYGMNFIDEVAFKNRDEFKINGQMGWTMHRNWSYSANMNLRSQFAHGYKSRTEQTATDVVSAFMAPGYFDISVGFTYKREGGPLKLTLSPIGGNVITVLDGPISSLGLYGVPAGRKVEGWYGPSVDVYFDKSFGRGKWLKYRSNLYGFMPYNDMGSPTMRWENTLEMRMTKYISTRLYGQMYYREKESTSLQYQYSFMIGLKYSFKNK